MSRALASLFLALVVAPLLLAACAAPRAASRTVTGRTASFLIQNDLRPGSAVTVRIASTAGLRRVLGSVAPQSSRTVTLDESSFAGQYRLIAETSDGEEIESRQFTLFANARVSWALFNNTLSVTGG